MANISLREYIRKIENLIENGQIDQAIGHCKHILQIYPKHIDSYRLLGKALLEKQKYGDASDIFQRVLSSVPDDFISHIGMSIIREDENNLDAAIWHMERAFEVQPSNKAVQDELRRLYTSRDGVAPPKIRLTRGALVRMYTRGELYNQAIAEIWAALSEDPNRVDLEVVLARIYFLLGQKVEATETCSKLISKLPYCYEANKILTEILPGTTREEDEKIFRQRVIDMDPYFQFVNEKTLATADVSDSNIMIDFLDWDPSVNVDEQPDWAQSIGFALGDESSSDEDFSSWINDIVSQPKKPLDLESEDEPESPTIVQQQENVDNLDESQNEKSEISFPSGIKKEEKEIPNWMKDAGWDVSRDDDDNLDKGFTIPSILPIEDEVSSGDIDNLFEDLSEADKEEDEEIQPAEIPGWLQEIAPSIKSINFPEEVDEFEVKNLEDLFDNLEKDKSEFIKSEAEISWEKEFTDEKDSSLEDTLQGFDFSSISLNEEESTTSFESEEKLASKEIIDDELDWIKDLSIEVGPVEIEEVPKSTTIDNFLEIDEEIEKHSLDQIINELEEIETEEIEPATTMDDDWLNSLVFDENKEDTGKDIFEEYEKEGIPDWIKSVIDEESEQPPIASIEDPGSLPDWLSIVDEKHENELDDIKISFDEIKDHLIPADNIIDFEGTAENYEETLPEEPHSELIDDEFLSSLEEQKTEDLDYENEISILEIEKSEESLGEVQPIDNSEETIISQIEDQKTEDLVPDFESSLQKFDKSEEFKEEDQPAIENEEDELESALAWMEGLALKQGADEETLVSKPEERSEIPPEWISEESKRTQDLSEELDSTPSWLKELEIETGEVQAQETAQTLEGISSTGFLDTGEDKEVVISSETNQDEDKVHDIENLLEELETEVDDKQTAAFDQGAGDEIDAFAGILSKITGEELLTEQESFHTETEENIEELIPQEEIEETESQVDITEQEVEEIESQELFPESSIEDVNSIEESEELSPAFTEEVVISEEILDVDGQKFEVIEEIAPSEDQMDEPGEEKEESIPTEQEFSSEIEDEIEDTQPVKVKDARLDELETANKFLYSGNPEEAIKIFDPLIHEGFELGSIIQNIQNALDHHYPIDINLWQSLGDAYLKNNQLQDALDAYSKAEDLLL